VLTTGVSLAFSHPARRGLNRRSRRVYLAILLSMGMTFINNSIYKKESYCKKKGTCNERKSISFSIQIASKYRTNNIPNAHI
jgi:hypothetical protein